MINKYDFDEIFVEMFEVIEEYNQSRLNDSKLSSVINSGLEVFLKYPNVVYASLFFLNESTFQFEQSVTIPKNYSEFTNEIFSTLIDNGVVGEALNQRTTKDIVLNDNTNNPKYYFVIPLLNSNGVMGMVIICADKKPEHIRKEFILLNNIFAGSFALALENALMAIKLEKTKEELSQMVASKTINLIQSRSKLAQKIENLSSNLAMTIPHEIRTPINQIMGSADYLLKHFRVTNVEETEEIISDVYQSARRLKELFDNYLFFAELNLKASNLAELETLKKQITTSVADTIYSSTIFLAKDFNREEDVHFEMEDFALAIGELYLKKAVDEIVKNALSFSEKGTPININVSKENSLCSIKITDYGIGLTEEQINNVDAYTQFERNINEQQGSGLGIAIIRRIADLHNGEFEISSQKDKFTTVIIKLPIVENFDF